MAEVGTIYYPSVAVNLTMLFDEALVKGGSSPDPKTPSDGADEASFSFGGATSKAGMFDVSDKTLTHVLAIVPRSATLELPTYRQAPKFNLSFNFRDLPIDPRAIRAMGVEVYIGTVTGSDWAKGMRGQVSNGRLMSQIQLKDENRMLVGVAESIAVKHGAKGSEVTMEGKGIVGMMLSAKVNAQQLKNLKLDQTIDKVVRQLLDMDAQGKKIPIRIGDGSGGSPNDWPDGVPKPAAQELVSRIMKGADGSKSNLPMKGDPNTVAVWDVITNFCNVVGAVPYFIGHELWIRPAKSIFQQKNAGQTGSTPFAGGKTRTIKSGNDTQTINFRKMVFGRDLLDVSFERKYGPTTVPAIRVVSLDNTKKGKESLLESVYPGPNDKEARRTAISPGGGEARTEITTISVPGITDKTRLDSIAQQLWHEIGRGEMKGAATTKELATLGGDNSDADIIRLRPGDAIEFGVDASGVKGLPPVVSVLNTEASQSVQQAIDEVNKRLGGNRQDLAKVLVGTARGVYNGLQNTFRVNNVKYAWSLDNGIGVDFDFQNYIEVRYDQAKAAGGGIADVTSSDTSSFSSSGGE